MVLTLWSDVERGLTNTELDTNFSELAAGGLSQTASDNRPLVKPSLNLDFTKGVLDPRVTFTRASTATYFGADGLLKTAGVNEPRFEYDPVTRQPKGLLIEEQRTNLLTYSEQFDNVVWSKSNINSFGSGSVSNTTETLDPVGGNSADKIVCIAATGFTSVGQNQGENQVSTSRSFSVYVKAAGCTRVQLVWKSQVSTNYKNFNLSTGLAVGGNSTSSSITPVGNGWYRLSITDTTTGAWAFVSMIDSDSSGYGGSFTGDGTSGIYIWGAQLEQGSFTTSYIPTTTAQVTRSADNASITGTNFSSWYRSDEGTFLSHVTSLTGGFPSPGSIFSLHTGNSANNYDPNMRINNGSWYIYSGSHGYPVNINYGKSIKTAFGYKTNDFAVSGDGRTPLTDSDGVTPLFDSLFFNVYYQNNEISSLCVKKLAFYPKRLSNTQLQELTK